MTIQAMKLKRADLLAKADAVYKKDDATADEIAQASAFAAEAKTLKARIEDAEEVESEHRALNTNKPRKTASQIESEATSGTFNDGAITDVKARFADDPNKGFKSHKDFLTSVVQHGDRDPRSAKDERLKLLAAAGSDEHGTYDNARGGFLLPSGFSPTLLTLPPEEDPTTGTTNIPLQATRTVIPARVDKDHTSSVSGGLTVSRRAETVAAGTSRMQLEGVALEVFSLFGGSYATEELLTDSPLSFVAILDKGFRDEFSAKLTDERLNGTGVGEFLGIMNSPAVVSVPKETGQPAATINTQNILKMMARSWRYGRSVWLANHNCRVQLAQLSLGTGTSSVPIYMPSAREGMPDMLFGRPIKYTEYAKTLGTTGDILLCDWNEYLEGTYQPLQSAESIHVRFLNHERTFKFWLRNAGAPWWKSALTPKNGSTLSPFVKLDTRS